MAILRPGTDLYYFPEPELLFNYDQSASDPRDGLRMFGPLDKGKPYGIRAGIVGTKDGLRRFHAWAEGIQNPILGPRANLARPPFPGFETVFGIPWDASVGPTLEVDSDALRRAANLDDDHQRVFETVSLYSNRILEAVRAEDASVDIWFVVIPEFVYKNCRPRSVVPKVNRVASDNTLPVNFARDLRDAPSLFKNLNEDAIPYQYDLDFHHQLKARLLRDCIATQIVRETKIAWREFTTPTGRLSYDFTNLETSIAWNLSCATFYKAGGRPWKSSGTRHGVCYVGLVFKMVERNQADGMACSGAQMFLESGEGMVFKGAVGPWWTGKKGEFHLSKEAAKELVKMCVASYTDKHGKPPKQLFIHGRAYYDDKEWAGFLEGAGKETVVIGIRIREDNDLKLFRPGDIAVSRGLAYVVDEYRAYLWTRGFIPRLMTYPGREVPNPLYIEVCRGRESINKVLADILALTKLNYNACSFADGLPVTLKFANAVGEILSAGPTEKLPPLPFKFYI